MKNALRRRHFRIWLVLALLLPILAALGIASRPDWPSQAAPDFGVPISP